jgi:hypothetical protein
MWCSNCQQDVPSFVPADAKSAARCARCRREFAPSSIDFASAAVASSKDKTNAPSGSLDCGIDLAAMGSARPRLVPPPPVEVNNWEFERDLRDAERLVKKIGVRHSAVAPTAPSPAAYLHSQHAQPAGWHASGKAPVQPTAAPRTAARQKVAAKATSRPRRFSFFAWLALSLGLTTFVCGAVLLTISFVANRDDLWGLGLPLALAGQAGLVVGLVLQLDVLWQSNRETSDTLHSLDGQLGELRHATTMLSTTHSAPAQSFYAHMAEGAGPELLLADLKGQLDLLAMKLADHR